jgi:hypothetical protein
LLHGNARNPNNIIGKIKIIETGQTLVRVKKLRYPEIANPPKNKNCLKLSGPRNLSSASTS